MKINYSILTTSKMLVEMDGKQLIITGEATTIPSFYADLKSMDFWENPFQEERLTDNEKEEIINFVTVESKKRGIEVIFD